MANIRYIRHIYIRINSCYNFYGVTVLRISIDNHELLMTASDGYDFEETREAYVESFIISPGERFDFVITPNQDVANYWIRLETLEDPNELGGAIHKAEAILRYKGASDSADYDANTVSKLSVSITCHGCTLSSLQRKKVHENV